MPYKDKRAKIKCRKLTMIEERWDMFDREKAKLEMKYGFMSNGGFLEYLLVLLQQHNQYEESIKRKTSSHKVNRKET